MTGDVHVCGGDFHLHLDLISELLKSNGHQVELSEILDRDAVELWVKGELVFKCKIADLEFGKRSQTKTLYAVQTTEVIPRYQIYLDEKKRQ